MRKRGARWEIPGREKRSKEENELAGKRRGAEDGQLPRARGASRNNGRLVRVVLGTRLGKNLFGDEDIRRAELAGGEKPRKVNVITFYGIAIILHCIILPTPRQGGRRTHVPLLQGPVGASYSRPVSARP